MAKFFVGFINLLIKGLASTLNIVFSFLPDSPFKYIKKSSTITEYLGYINYAFPVSEIIIVLEMWLAAIAIYYAHMLILRWIKAIR